MTKKERKERCIQETKQHKEEVRKLCKLLGYKIIERGEVHDNSKLESPELEYFVEHTEKLHGLTYGSDEYNESLEKLKPALDHHYANNRHHPNHFPNGLFGANLIDVLEMLADWYSSSKRHDDGNILKSIEINAKRFAISEELTAILFNTVSLLELQ